MAIFGHLADGREIREITIAAGAFAVSVIALGAAVRDVQFKGVDHPLVLGFDSLDGYLEQPLQFGAVIGRCANRIARGRASVDGHICMLSLNDGGKHHLDGGVNGFGRRPWRVVETTRSSATLALSDVDGAEGYPGNVEVSCRYRVEPPATLRMELEAICDRPTLMNLAQRPWFNLDGSPDVGDHEVKIFAETYAPADADNIPTGEMVSVAHSDYDFRASRPLRLVRDGRRIPYDKGFVVARSKTSQVRPHARLTSPANGVSLLVSSTEPVLWLCDGGGLPSTPPGPAGRPGGPWSACCLSPQGFPDAPNHPAFAKSVLRPGETYRQVTTFAFSRV